ncbi:hypothetical protein BY996DRAFT_6534645 [Phakopsora pachyrhizi]|nr:hypothetical protein BY996DRAFT_6534645 [Phakopsora pachyrhizi]
MVRRGIMIEMEIDSSDSVLTRADLAWSISGWRMTDEVVMLKGKWLLVTVTGVRALRLGPQDWNDFEEGQSSVLQGRDENLFKVEFKNDLMDSPPAVDWKVVMVVVAVTVDDRTNDWLRWWLWYSVEGDEEEIISQSKCEAYVKRLTQRWDCAESDYADADADSHSDFDDLWR